MGSFQRGMVHAVTPAHSGSSYTEPKHGIFRPPQGGLFFVSVCCRSIRLRSAHWGSSGCAAPVPLTTHRRGGWESPEH
jgi:hypothetical protein